MPEALRPALFLDRDGVINRRRLDHVKSWEEFEFLPGVLQALAALRALDAAVVVVTNQSAVGRGLISVSQLHAIHQRMLHEVERAGGHITAIYTCLHAPADACRCRKPSPVLIQEAAADLGIDLAGSLMVGDSATDIQAAEAAGVRPILLGASGVSLDQDVTSARAMGEVVMLWRTLAVTEAALPC